MPLCPFHNENFAPNQRYRKGVEGTYNPPQDIVTDTDYQQRPEDPSGDCLAEEEAIGVRNDPNRTSGTRGVCRRCGFVVYTRPVAQQP